MEERHSPEESPSWGRRIALAAVLLLSVLGRYWVLAGFSFLLLIHFEFVLLTRDSNRFNKHPAFRSPFRWLRAHRVALDITWVAVFLAFFMAVFHELWARLVVLAIGVATMVAYLAWNIIRRWGWLRVKPGQK
jgi:hypothetical protein